MNVTESIKFNKLQEENEKLKNQLAKKDKEIELMNEQCDGAIREILEQQLYKEDFIEDEIICKCKNINCDFPGVIQYVLKDNSKYDKLPSKDVK